jgi:amidase
MANFLVLSASLTVRVRPPICTTSVTPANARSGASSNQIAAMRFDEYRQYDALGLAELVARGEVTPTELLELAIARTTALSPQLSAVVMPMFDLARQRAGTTLSGPFAGVPFLVKDMFQEHKGVPSLRGNRALKFRARPEPRHAEITSRWLDAGLVIFGRTNTPELGLKGITEPQAWPPARNPWNPLLTPGGSSGGAAAAVASGMVPMAGANDGGGSIRIPAACCGLFGFKPGRGRTPWGPGAGEQMHGAILNHAITRSVRDSAALLDASHGSEIGSPCILTPPVRPYAEEARSAPGRLRIAFSAHSPLGTPVDEVAWNAVTRAVQLLLDLGHQVEEAAAPVDGNQLALDFLTLWFARCAAGCDELQRAYGLSPRDFEPDTRAMAAFGRALRADDYALACARIQQYAYLMAQFHTAYDVYLTPTLAHAPPRIGALRTRKIDEIMMRLLDATGLLRPAMRHGLAARVALDSLSWTPFTQLANLTGAPAMSVPLHWDSNNLPVGVHFSAGAGQEDLLFRLAGQLEQAQPWFGRVAPIAPDIACAP